MCVGWTCDGILMLNSSRVMVTRERHRSASRGLVDVTICHIEHPVRSLIQPQPVRDSQTVDGEPLQGSANGGADAHHPGREREAKAEVIPQQRNGNCRLADLEGSDHARENERPDDGPSRFGDHASRQFWTTTSESTCSHRLSRWSESERVRPPLLRSNLALKVRVGV